MDLVTLVLIEGICYMGKFFATLPDPIRARQEEEKYTEEERRRLHQIEGKFLVLPTPLDFLYLGYLGVKGLREFWSENRNGPVEGSYPKTIGRHYLKH
jgi:hypothetical protein